jgi:PAS domain S-box-containing protein
LAKALSKASPRTISFKVLSDSINASPDAIVVSYVNDRIEYANAAALELFGYSAEQIKSILWRELYSVAEDAARISSRVALPDISKSSAVLPVTIRTQSGSTVDAAVTIGVVRKADRAPTHIIHSFRSRASVLATQNHSNLLDQTLEVRLARGIAHDFNNLLAIIAGNVQLAGMHAQSDPQRRYLNEASLACGMAAELTHRLMAFAKGQHLAPENLSIPRAIEAQAPLLRRVAGEARQLKIDIPAALPIVRVDKSAFENAVMNLVLNACDATGDGGTISLSAAVTPQSEATSAQPTVTFAVSDDGIGMTPLVAARAFDPFFTTKSSGRGTGLGLATVLGFARQSGGDAAISSEPGRGTTVSLWLPIAHLEQQD